MSIEIILGANPGVNIETNANPNAPIVVNDDGIDQTEYLNLVSADAALSLRINSVSASGGGGSVTSTELSAAVAVETSNRTSADNVLSVAIAAVSNALSAKRLTSLADVSGTPSDGQVLQWNSAASKFQFSTVAAGTGSVTSTELSAGLAGLSATIATNSAQMTSADNRLSNTITNLVVDELANVSAPSPTDQQVLTFNSADGKWHASTIVAGAGSVTSTELSAVSAAAASADASLSTRIDTQSAALVSVNNRISGVSAAVSTISADLTSVQNRLSAVSAQVSSNSAQMTSADNAISNAVSIVSVAQAATSAAVTSVNDRVSGISTQLTSVQSALSALSQALSAKTISSLIGVSITGATDQQVLTYNSADGKWHASTIVAGSGSVTSTELSAVSAAAASADATLSTRIDTASNAVSIVSVAQAATSAAQAATSAAVTSVNNRVSAISATVSSNSAQMTSADNAISNAVSIVSVAQAATSAAQAVTSAAQAATSAAVTSVNNRVSGISAAVSVLSADLTSTQTRIGTNSATLTSVQSALSAISQALSAKTISSLIGVSIAGATDQQFLVYNSADGKWHASTVAGSGSVTSDEMSIAVAALSSRVTSVQSSLSTTQSSLSALSADVTSAKDRLSALSSQVTSADNAISNAVSIVSAYVVKTVAKEFAGGNISTGSTVVDWANGNAQAFSILSAAAIAAPTNGSAGVTYLLKFQQDGTGSKQLTWNSAFMWQGGVTPTLGGASAIDIVGFYYDGTKYYGRHDTLSVTIQGGSVTSTELSAVSAAAASANATLLSSYLTGLGTTQLKQVADVQGISATTLTDISGLSLAFSANGTYEIHSHIIYQLSGVGNVRFGYSTPGASRTQGFVWANRANGTGIALSAFMAHGAFNFTAAGNSVVLSTTSVVSAAADVGVMMDALVVSAAAGTFKMMAATSVTTAPINIQPGSYIRAFKIG
jgi:predicted  nucleic acid-binding Zn-ribbon protein